VLVTGESGTGKELVARAIHEASPARIGQYIPVNVAAIPDNLVESELFGHVRGAFTDARQDRQGAFRSASGGTLLLDEIGDLPLHSQPKLLRALEQGEVLPVGSDIPIDIDTRVIAATAKNLQEQASRACFRTDLLYRLNAIQIHIPPLRERPEDIPLLVEYYCKRYCRQAGKPLKHVSRDAMRCLLKHAWNGNVRELAHTLEHAVLLTDGDTIAVGDLPPALCDGESKLTDNLHDAVDAFRRLHIIRTLEIVAGDRTSAAEQLGISPATLFRYIDKYGLKGYAIGR